MTLLFGGAVALLLFAVMGFTIAGVAPWSEEGTQANVDKANEQASVVDTLFGPQVIAFEVLGILLTAVMIGALVIARPIDAVDDENHYSHPTAAQVAESDKASDPAAHALRNPVPAAKEAGK